MSKSVLNTQIILWKGRWESLNWTVELSSVSRLLLFFAHVQQFSLKTVFFPVRWKHARMFLMVTLKRKNTFGPQNGRSDKTLPLHINWWGHVLHTGREGGGREETTTPPVVIRFLSNSGAVNSRRRSSVKPITDRNRNWKTTTIIKLECSSITRQASYHLCFIILRPPPPPAALHSGQGITHVALRESLSGNSKEWLV